MWNFKVVENGCINSGEVGGLVVTNEVSKDFMGAYSPQKKGGSRGNGRHAWKVSKPLSNEAD